MNPRAAHDEQRVSDRLRWDRVGIKKWCALMRAWTHVRVYVSETAKRPTHCKSGFYFIKIAVICIRLSEPPNSTLLGRESIRSRVPINMESSFIQCIRYMQKSFCCRSKRISHVRPHCFSLKFSIRFAARLMASSCMNKTPMAPL